MHLKTYHGHFTKEQIREKIYFPFDNYEIVDPGGNELLLVRKGISLSQIIESGSRWSRSREIQNSKFVKHFRLTFFPTEVRVSIALNLWAIFFIIPFLVMVLFIVVNRDATNVKIVLILISFGVYFITKYKTAQIVDYLFKDQQH